MESCYGLWIAVVSPCSLVDGYKDFGRTYHFHLQGEDSMILQNYVIHLQVYTVAQPRNHKHIFIAIKVSNVLMLQTADPALAAERSRCAPVVQRKLISDTIVLSIHIMAMVITDYKLYVK
jgi:hypothetical protein